MTNSERASYIRGLMEGLELDQGAKETKVFNAMIELLDDLCASVEELEDGFDTLSEEIDEIDEDLGELEELMYDECGCGDHDHDFDEDLDFEVKCPSCGKVIALDEEMLDEGAIKCPECGESLEFDFDEDDMDACGCDHCGH